MDRALSRRSLLRVGGGTLSVGVFGRVPATSRSSPIAAARTASAPSVAWRQTYCGCDWQYVNTIYDVTQSSDGGFALAGTGQPIRETGLGKERFSLLRTDSSGNEQWFAFAEDGIADTRQDGEAVVSTTDGGYAVVGYGKYTDDPALGHKLGTTVAEAAKFTPDGDIAWIRKLDAYEAADPDADHPGAGGEDSAAFRDAVPGPNGGFIAAGRRGRRAWVVKFSGDGGIEWQAEQEGVREFSQVFAHGGCYQLAGLSANDDHTAFYTVRVARDGTVRRTVPFEIDYDQVPYNHVMVPVAAGGYALTGRHADRTRMVLIRADENGGQEWMKTYNGPDDGYDWAVDVVTTADEGYALGGYMTAAESELATATVLKTDADGSEQWRLLDETDGVGSARALTPTVDGGFAYLGGVNTLVKVAAIGSDEGTGSGNETDSTGTPGGESTPSGTADSSTGSAGGSAPGGGSLGGGGSAGGEPAPGGTGSGPLANTGDATGTPLESTAGTDGSTSTGNSTAGTRTPTSTGPRSTDGSTTSDTREATGTPLSTGRSTTETSTEGPGFGLIATAGGLASAAIYLVRRSTHEDP